jgi:ABC-type transporter Mla maintaining outer membrane lipid asymmetry ATPase subunit MlaF
VYPEISVSGLRKSFGDTVVLDGLDLSVTEGTVLALLGPTVRARRRWSTSWPR